MSEHAENHSSDFSKVPVPPGCTLMRKETFEYTTPHAVYRVDLYENQEETFYAIAVPEDSEKLVIYGTPNFKSKEKALLSLVDKIRREGVEKLFSEKNDVQSEENELQVEDDNISIQSSTDDQE
ncbi:hypothetical protein D2Q93_01580 [Alicyclobacillaceae bacterium I2511]|jgi:hypothetical protein|nr:hypothetical protein D2Q93_01580 [Alicyclobacillaceae bacterium I2511]